MLPLLHPSPSSMLGCAPFPLCVGPPALVETCCQKFLVRQSPKPQPSNPVKKKIHHWNTEQEYTFFFLIKYTLIKTELNIAKGDILVATLEKKGDFIYIEKIFLSNPSNLNSAQPFHPACPGVLWAKHTETGRQLRSWSAGLGTEEELDGYTGTRCTHI